MSNNTKEKYALVTGATEGIGFELARLLAKDGYHLIIVARHDMDLIKTAEKLKSEYGVRVEHIAKDLFDPQGAFELYAEIKGKGIDIN